MTTSILFILFGLTLFVFGVLIQSSEKEMQRIVNHHVNMAKKSPDSYNEVCFLFISAMSKYSYHERYTEFVQRFYDQTR